MRLVLQILDTRTATGAHRLVCLCAAGSWFRPPARMPWSPVLFVGCVLLVIHMSEAGLACFCAGIHCTCCHRAMPPVGVELRFKIA